MPTIYSVTLRDRHLIGTKASVMARAGLSHMDWNDGMRMGRIETVNTKSYASDMAEPFPF